MYVLSFGSDKISLEYKKNTSIGIWASNNKHAYFCCVATKQKMNVCWNECQAYFVDLLLLLPVVHIDTAHTVEKERSVESSFCICYIILPPFWESTNNKLPFPNHWCNVQKMCKISIWSIFRKQPNVSCYISFRLHEFLGAFKGSLKFQYD